MGSGRNDDAYKDMCDRFSNYYKDGNYSLAISAIFVAYRFVLASDIKTMTEENSTVEKGVPNRKNVLLNGILVKRQFWSSCCGRFFKSITSVIPSSIK